MNCLHYMCFANFTNRKKKLELSEQNERKKRINIVRCCIELSITLDEQI